MAEQTDRLIQNRNGYRVLGGSPAGMRTTVTGHADKRPPTAKPLDVPRDVRAARAKRVAGATS